MFKMELEEEMEFWHSAQMAGEVENPMFTYFPGDQTIVKTMSNRAGMISFTEVDSAKGNCYLRMIFVTRHNRGLGIGKAFIEVLSELCISEGVKAIEVESENNSFGFFKSLGFELMKGKPNNRMILKL